MPRYNVQITARSWENIPCVATLTFDHEPTRAELLAKCGDYQSETVEVTDSWVESAPGELEAAARTIWEGLNELLDDDAAALGDDARTQVNALIAVYESAVPV